MKEEQSVPRSRKREASVKKKGHFASVRRSSQKIQLFEEEEDDSPDESCKPKQRFLDITFSKSTKEDFTTTLACQLDIGATFNVIGLDDLSAITQL